MPQFPRISNHTDFDTLLLHPEVSVQFEKDPAKCVGADLVILAGSKSVRDDLKWLNKMGWDDFINKHLRYGGKLIGICGGFQMLGKAIHDPDEIEGKAGSSEALGLLEMETYLQTEKYLQKVSGLIFDDIEEGLNLSNLFLVS